MQRVPLAERMRPKNLNDVIGQTHLLGEKGVLRQIVTNKEPVSLILWGPPGSGKTTLARIIANEVDAEFVELSAVTSGKKDINKIIEHAKQNWNLKIRTILFVDEIHRFNKAQQDAFLPHVESGLITLIGATTENPSFEIINPLLSRTRVLILEPLSEEDIIKILKKAIKLEKITKRITPKAIEFIAKLSNGDARIALSDLELALSLNEKVTPEIVKKAIEKHLPSYDKKGDIHYNIISAFIKSMRGGDVDAALYYLERMVEAGEDPKFIARRMVIFASEDIGLAGNGALGLALNAFQAIERVGMPESNIILAHVVTALTKSQKSRQTTNAMYRAQDLARKYPNLNVPIHLRNASTKLMKDIGYGENYKWQAGFKHEKGFLPEEIKDEKIF
ncbi:MAG: replication-associated recombination protein A [Candidatus Saccharimonadales bacterium]